jgi:hypothetical protein
MQLVNYLKDMESPYTVEVKKHRNTRYYWKCIVQVLAQELGYFNDEMHDILRAKFLNEWQMIEINNNKIGLNKIVSTTSLNTKEFENYAEQIRIWALSDLGIRLMLPNEYQ